MNHSILPPSGMSIIVPCPGSVMLGADIPDEETEDTRIGEAVHWVGEHMLKVMTGERSKPETYLGIRTPNDVIVTEEMLDCATIYFETVKAVASKGDGNLNIECQRPIPEIHEVCFGTNDADYWDADDGILYVWDYKHGHASVDAVDNYQLAAYASGILSELGVDDQHVRLSLNIVQPRCYDGKGVVRTWNCMASDIRGHVNQMHMAAEEAMSPSPMLNAGLHCHYCKARYRCQVNQAAVARRVDYALLTGAQELSNEALAYELEVLEEAEAIVSHRKDALEAEALARALKGQAIPGRALEQGYSNNKWSQPVEDVIILGDMMGVDLRSPPSTITPAQAINLLKKNHIDESVINGYYGKQPTAMKLVKDDGSKARNVFHHS